jgi:hypothetical protein
VVKGHVSDVIHEETGGGGLLFENSHTLDSYNMTFGRPLKVFAVAVCCEQPHLIVHPIGQMIRFNRWLLQAVLVMASSIGRRKNSNLILAARAPRTRICSATHQFASLN